MQSLSFQLDGNRQLTVVDDCMHDADSADNVSCYDTIHRVPSRGLHSVNAKYGIRLRSPGGLSASCLVVLQGTTELNRSTVAFHDDVLYLTGGLSLCALGLDDLEMMWHADLLSGASNGVHFLPDHGCLIAVGAFDMTCIELSGDIRWATIVVDFLTEKVSIDAENITVVDDHGNQHTLEIETGTKIVG